LFIHPRRITPSYAPAEGRLVRYIFAFLSFNNTGLFPLIGISVFYGAQSIAGILRFSDRYAVNFLVIGCVSCLTYYVSYTRVFRESYFRRLVNRPNRIRLRFSYFAILFLVSYTALVIYAAYTVNEVALVAAIRGAGAAELAESREYFLRTRTGWEASLKYFNAICMMSIIPYIMATLFHIRHKLRVPLLCLFLFSLMLTLERSLAVMALFPLVVLFANRKAKTRALGLTLLLVIAIVATTHLARGGLTEGSSGGLALSGDYTITSESGIIGYVVDRVVWIPYMTAYDWLRFQNDILGGKYTLGSSISFVSTVLGTKYIPLEREVFRYQWGQNVTGTGSSNTVYFIDAFLNFGILGSIIYSITLALIVRVISVSDNTPAKAAVYIPLFALAANSLTAVLFSGGLGILLCIVFLLRPATGGGRQLNEESSDNRRLRFHRLESRRET